MTIEDQRAAGERPRLSAGLTWLISVPANLLLGMLGVFPFMFLMMLVHGTAQALGWVDPDPAAASFELFRDGVTLPVAAVAFTWMIFLPSAAVPNWLVVRRTSVPKPAYWPVSIALLLVPFVVVNLCHGEGLSDIWTTA